jgi:hypothetical protein
VYGSLTHHTAALAQAFLRSAAAAHAARERRGRLPELAQHQILQARMNGIPVIRLRRASGSTTPPAGTADWLVVRKCRVVAPRQALRAKREE